MRISQFFSIDTAKCLARMAEYSPNLMDRVIRREPNAYLAALYWESEMFRSSKLSKEKERRDYKKLCFELLSDDKNFPTPMLKKNAEIIRAFIMRNALAMQPKHYKRAYEILYAGDPKRRSTRALYTEVFSTLTNDALKEAGR